MAKHPSIFMGMVHDGNNGLCIPYVSAYAYAPKNQQYEQPLNVIHLQPTDQ